MIGLFSALFNCSGVIFFAGLDVVRVFFTRGFYFIAVFGVLLTAFLTFLTVRLLTGRADGELFLTAFFLVVAFSVLSR